MGGKRLGWTLAISGTAIVALSVFADALGIGAGDYVFGWDQKAGVAIGCTAVLFAYLTMRGWRLAIERHREPAASWRVEAPRPRA